MTSPSPTLFGRRWFILIGVILSIAALWLAIRGVDLAFVLDRLGQAQLGYLLAALAVGAIQVGLRTARWQILLPARADGSRVARRRLVPIVLIGYLGNVALPARLGEFARTLLVSRREGLDSVAVFGTVVLERMLDLFALAVFALLVAANLGAPSWMIGAAVLVAILAGIALAIATRGLSPLVAAFSRHGEANGTRASALDFPGARAFLRIVRRFATGVGGHQTRRALSAAALLSFLAWPLDAALVWLVGRSIDINLSLGAAALISAAAVLSTAVPSAPGYVGTYELAAAFTARALGVADSPAFALAVLVHVLTVVPAAVGGAISMLALRSSFGPRSDAAQRRRQLRAE